MWSFLTIYWWRWSFWSKIPRDAGHETRKLQSESVLLFASRRCSCPKCGKLQL
jgi:hypothetical protein